MLKAPQALVCSNIYHNCAVLPLYNFIKVITTNDISWLIVDGEADEIELAKTWEAIYTEYSDIVPSSASAFILQLTRDIKAIELKLWLIQSIIDRWKVSYLPELIPIMHEYGFLYDFTPESMLEDVEKTIMQSKSLVIQKQIREREYKEYIASNKGKEATEFDYDELLSELSKFQGYALRSRDLSVSEFVAILVRFNRQNNNGKTADR